MPTKISDVKKLWGASGGRCSICKKELSTVDNTEVLGEMAHIIARSVDGPRGNSKLTLKERDFYENLILVCPNDHKSIDTNTKEWSIEKLRTAKAEHELWVSRQFENGKLSPTLLDGSKFLVDRAIYWEKQNEHVWSFVALTPLTIVDEVLEPVNNHFKEAINGITLPASLGSHINPYLTEPSVNGLVHEDFRNLVIDTGHRFELWRTGHIEFITCIDFLLKIFPVTSPKSDDEAKQRRAQEHRLNNPSHFIPYEDLAEMVVSQLKSILGFWQKTDMRFNDMIITANIIGIEMASLFVPGGVHSTVTGRPVESKTLKYSTVINRDISEQELINIVFRRLVNYFGLEIDSVFDDKGNFNRPTGHH